MRRFLIVLAAAFPWFANAKAPKPAPSTGEFAPAKKEQDASAPPVEKPKSFTVTADEVTGSGFVSIDKDGTRITHTVTKDTQISQGAKPATVSDLKVGDVIVGLRKWVSDTQYEIVKITKFTHKPAPPTKPPAKKPGAV